MSVKKTINDEFQQLYSGFNRIALEIHDSLSAFDDKLNRKKKVTLKSRVIAARNWLSFLLLCLIAALLLNSCYFAARNYKSKTPWTDTSADTLTLKIFNKKPYKKVSNL